MNNMRRVEDLALPKAPEDGGLEEISLEGLCFKTIADLETHVSHVRAMDGIEFEVDVKLDSQQLSDALRVFVEDGVTRLKQSVLRGR